MKFPILLKRNAQALSNGTAKPTAYMCYLFNNVHQMQCPRATPFRVLLCWMSIRIGKKHL